MLRTANLSSASDLGKKRGEERGMVTGRLVGDGCDQGSCHWKKGTGYTYHCNLSGENCKIWMSWSRERLMSSALVFIKLRFEIG
jgi:hypothetical protein